MYILYLFDDASLVYPGDLRLSRYCVVLLVNLVEAGGHDSRVTLRQARQERHPFLGILSVGGHGFLLRDIQDRQKLLEVLIALRAQFHALIEEIGIL